MLHKFRIVMKGANRGEVFIDGEKVNGVTAIEFSASVDAMSMIKLTFHAADVDVEGVADITTIGDTEHRFQAAA
jgi:hypothetical protein